MSSATIFGIVLLVVGAILLFFGYQASQAVGDQVVETLTGRFSDKTMWYLLGGVAAVVSGLFVTIFKKKSA
jgi:LPXTG-motif cell wall-anchored protein